MEQIVSIEIQISMDHLEGVFIYKYRCLFQQLSMSLRLYFLKTIKMIS